MKPTDDATDDHDVGNDRQDQKPGRKRVPGLRPKDSAEILSKIEEMKLRQFKLLDENYELQRCNIMLSLELMELKSQYNK
jgi:hypothetical protein